MPVTETSMTAFKKINLGQRQIAVHLALKTLTRATDLEIAEYLGKPINEITPRRNELVKLGYAKENGRKVNPSGNTAKAWTYTTPEAERILKFMSEAGDCEG